MNDHINIVCVYKTGGDYSPKYVDKLYSMLKSKGNISFQLTCLTDDETFNNNRAYCLPLLHGWRGWWSKIEAFRIIGPVLYFDLDTMIINDISMAAEMVKKCKNDEIIMLRPFKETENWASGIMAWNGDWSWLCKNFNPAKDIPRFRWDQRYISDRIQNYKIKAIQDFIPGIYSYKHHCRSSIPSDARIICFHGKPRPHEVKKLWT